LTQYMQTTSFLYAVGDKLPSYGVTDQHERNLLINSMGANVHVVSTGAHLVTLNFSCQKAASCTAVLGATVAVFQDRLTAGLKAQEQMSTTFLQAQLDAPQKRYTTSQAALESYLAAHPGSLAAPAGQQTGNAQLDALVTQAPQDRDQVTPLQNQLGQAQFTFAAADRFIQNDIQVVDAPRITKGGILGDGSSLKRAAIVWLAAVGVAAFYLVLVVWMDKTARDARELAGLLSVPILATVPKLSLREKF